MVPTTPAIRSLSDLPDLATTGEVAAVLRCSPRHVTDLCNKGLLPAVRIAKCWLIEPKDVKDYVEKEKQKCRDATKGRTSNGEKTGNVGKSSGSNTEAAAASRRALRIVGKLKDSSPTSSQTNDQKGQVIQLNAT